MSDKMYLLTERDLRDAMMIAAESGPDEAMRGLDHLAPDWSEAPGCAKDADRVGYGWIYGPVHGGWVCVASRERMHNA